MTETTRTSNLMYAPDDFWGDGQGVTFTNVPGYVRLTDTMGGDLAVVNHARESFQLEHVEMEQEDPKLIDFLLRNRHGTPFEAAVFSFQVACPIFVAREWFRHRIGSFNEMSGRYTKLKPVFYVPAQFRKQTGKPGAYTFEPLDCAPSIGAAMRSVYLTAWAYYELALSQNVAKELARLVLPVAIFTEFRWTVNARSLMNFLSLRLAPNAMLEIRQLAQAVGGHFEATMPHTHESFMAAGTVAP